MKITDVIKALEAGKRVLYQDVPIAYWKIGVDGDYLSFVTEDAWGYEAHCWLLESYDGQFTVEPEKHERYVMFIQYPENKGSGSASLIVTPESLQNQIRATKDYGATIVAIKRIEIEEGEGLKEFLGEQE